MDLWRIKSKWLYLSPESFTTEVTHDIPHKLVCDAIENKKLEYSKTPNQR